MEEISEKLYSRLHKLNRLAQQGVGGEATNAAELLKALLEQNNLTHDDFFKAEEKIIEWEYVYATEIEQRLFYQVAAYLGLKTYGWAHNRRGKRAKTIIIEDTQSKIEDFKLHFEIWWAEFQAEMEATFIAFVAANDIYAKNGKSSEKRDLTPIERKAIMRAAEIEKTQIRKRIEA